VNVSCNKCGKKYVIADDKVAGKASVKIRCKQCQNLIQVSVGQAAAPAPAPAAVSVSIGGESLGGEAQAEERTRMMPAPDVTAAWFAMVGGKQIGPMDLKGLSVKVSAGEITLRTYLWKNGMAEWKRASDVPDVSTVFAGVSVGATATGPTQAAPETRKSGIRNAPSAQMDVALANETPVRESAPAATSGPTTAPTTAPSANPFGGDGGGGLNGLFDDISGVNKTGEQQAYKPSEPAAEQHTDPNQDGQHVANVPPGVDPFSLVDPANPSELPPPGEATRFFIAQAGVNKRNPPWKIALFIFGLIGLPVSALYLLSSLHVVTLEITRTTEDGKVVQESFFSEGGITGLKDLLSGDAKRKREEAEKKAKEAEALAAKQKADALARAQAAKNKPDEKDDNDPFKSIKPQDPNLKNFYEDQGLKGSVVPKVRHNAEEGSGQAVNQAGGLSPEAIGKVVAGSKAFAACIDQALRRNPNLSVGAITVTLTVGSSGAVKSAGIEPKKHEGSDWAQCMMSAGKRLTFPASDGETEVQLPFKIGVAVSP
jgi:hypothetical protein